VALTVHEDRPYLRKLIEVGATGYVLKRSAPEDLLRAIHAVAAGGLYLDPAIAGQAIDGCAGTTRESAAGRGVDLSEREIEVLRLSALGHSNKAIATKLQISIKSIETCKSRAMDKFAFVSRVELMSYALSAGWLAED
jgi:DNA-binding NarL/FixJ family response regulator